MVIGENFGPWSIYLRDRKLTRENRPDVVLLQGFGTGPRAMRPLADKLAAAQLRSAVAPLGGLFGHLQTRGVGRNARKLAEYLCSLETRPWIVGHSIGGIMARLAIQREGVATRVQGLITMGAPHVGTPAAIGGLAVGLGVISTSLYQIMPLSPAVIRLNRTPWPLGVKLISISGSRDVLCPPRFTRIPFADGVDVRDVRFDGLGHTEMLRDPAVLDWILREILAGGTID